MQQVRLTAVEELVFVATTGLESRGEVPYLAAIARETGLPEEQLNQPLHELTSKNLLHREESPLDNTDLGPRWCTQQRT
ncbi:hypothetical protein SAMN05444365_104246 [Micromonospora pattaloongensis]|uniref:IclR helix-turn-helix domain-containing protein n=1 Tax=Micromonospora pattaloongensis TaxID=405436 RepID=A0A1H3P1F2_9ACTN|nr:hypothetical protein [Micromonospora pattaloongensis]SDY94239.1 hypothetical protein SAMN05444365_104246 [Micromonospora pattaloongensis]